ncbi:MAG: uroporphyrinogen-III C-methyltransferase [Bacteroidia bacterium]|nr:MAG: uroporphyrinogen-III C-methyltransferase [Bacteroidia bacterium]
MQQISFKKAAKVTLVGAGPGDPELITLKGVKALQNADVVLYDALACETLLDFAPKKAIKKFVGKRAGHHSYSQTEINELIATHAKEYGHVVRLKGGDPFVFGRGFEELQHVSAQNIPVTVIPGISSAISVPGLQHIPLTHRGLSEGFWVITGTKADRQLSADIYNAAKSNATVVVLMGYKKISQIIAVFKLLGKHNLPVAIIENGSTPQEKIVLGKVSSILEKLMDETITGPTILIFGEVVSLHPSYQQVNIPHAAVI